MEHLIQRIFGWFRTKPAPTPLPGGIEWFRITCDDTGIRLDVSAPGRQPWTDFVSWGTVERVAFEATDFLLSDDLYIWASDRPEARLIPMDAIGADALWNQLLDRKLFCAQLAITAMCSTSGVFVWPEPTG